LTKPRTK